MAGIYIHIPFCKQKCTYCDFHFSTTFDRYRSQMLKAMLHEIDSRSSELNEKIKTIYFGGGTPSLLKSEEIKEFLIIINSKYELSDDVEITLEANPDDISTDNVKEWVNLGINRLSIGIQSFDNEDLLWMNRAHNAKESLEAVKIAQMNGIDNISIDLIYGLPNMDEKRWKKQIKQATVLNVKHISAYCLTVEEKTKLNQLVKTKAIVPANNEMQAKHFEILQEELKKASFIQYEISNFGIENYFSKHNSSYWKGEKYMGIGPSAHSFDGKNRSWNISNNALYIAGLEKNQRNFTSEELSPKDIFNEYLMTGLRTTWGVNLSKLNAIIPLTDSFNEKMKHLLSEEKAFVKEDNLYLTEKGMLFADAIALELFED
ncbi:MAG: radical SAM family heme chaperone HemW [Flavobacteriia bacterium]|jgi:oxygen-independent coproporphyrinogen-3 oxidase